MEMSLHIMQKISANLEMSSPTKKNTKYLKMFLVKRITCVINIKCFSKNFSHASDVENFAKLFTGLLPLNAVLTFAEILNPESAFTICRF